MRYKPPRRDYKYEITTIRLSAEAWDNLQAAAKVSNHSGRGPRHGVMRYVEMLLAANPSSTYTERNAYWRDARPSDYKQWDGLRLKHGQFKQWLPGDYSGMRYKRMPRTIQVQQLLKLTPSLVRLADHFFIGGQKAAPTDRIRAANVLEAIGLGFLRPSEPVPEAAPKKRKTQSQWELPF